MNIIFHTFSYFFIFFHTFHTLLSFINVNVLACINKIRKNKNVSKFTTNICDLDCAFLDHVEDVADAPFLDRKRAGFYCGMLEGRFEVRI
jgi:hypothetical protein